MTEPIKMWLVQNQAGGMACDDMNYASFVLASNGDCVTEGYFVTKEWLEEAKEVLSACEVMTYHSCTLLDGASDYEIKLLERIKNLRKDFK